MLSVLSVDVGNHLREDILEGGIRSLLLILLLLLWSRFLRVHNCHLLLISALFISFLTIFYRLCFGLSSGYLILPSDHFLNNLWVGGDGIYGHAGSRGERILLFDLNLRCLIELVRAQQTQDGVLVISQDDITSSVQLNENVVGMLALAELEIYHTIDAQLLHFFQLFGTHVLPELHGKAGGHILLVTEELSCVQSYTSFNE